MSLKKYYALNITEVEHATAASKTYLRTASVVAALGIFVHLQKADLRDCPRLY